MMVCINGENISEETIKECLYKKKKRIQKYVEIMKKLKENNGKLSELGKKKYKSFYGMNHAFSLSKDFYKIYFKYLEDNYHNTEINFSEVLDVISKASGRIEKSFASKLLATINPNRAVWDKNVSSRLELPEPKSIEEAKELYDELEKKLKIQYLNDKSVKKYIKIFDETFKDENWNLKDITPMKKIDLILWSLGKKTKKDKSNNK